MIENQSVERADAAQNTRAARSRGGTIGLQGRRRQLELAREAEVERQGEAAKLIAGIGRELDALERDLLDEYVALTIEGRRLRRAGKSTLDIGRVKSRIAAQLGLRRDAAGKRPALEPTPTALERYRAELDAGASRVLPSRSIPRWRRCRSRNVSGGQRRRAQARLRSLNPRRAHIAAPASERASEARAKAVDAIDVLLAEGRRS
jgi:hypothetical protein